MSLTLGGDLGAHAGHLFAKLNDGAVVDDPVNGGRGCQRVLEDPVPFREDQIGSYDDAAPFIALGQEGEQDLHLFPALLHIAQVVDNQPLER